MKLQANKWYIARDGSKWYMDWVGDRHATAHAENGDVRIFQSDGVWLPRSDGQFDLISEYTQPPAVGSYKWAMALPEGTKIRHKRWARGWIKRINFNWVNPDGDIIQGPAVCAQGWLLYEPKLRPWKAEEVPLGAWQKHKGDDPHKWLIATSQGLYDDWLANCLHSIDQGKTWLPCGVKE